MATATLTSKGQITVPKAVREALRLKAGDRVEFLVGEDGTVTIWPVTADVRTLKGLLPKPRRRVSVEEMNAVVRERGSRH